MQPTEYLDIVTDDNQLTGTSALRTEIHAKGLYHRVVNVMFFRVRDGKTQLLCHQRADCVENNPGRWDPAIGGHLQSGKTVEEGLLDEIREEVGLLLNFDDLIEGPCLKISDPDEKKFNYFYYYPLESTEDIRMNLHEVAMTEFIDLEQVIESMRQHPDKWAGFPERLNLMLEPLLQKYT